MQDLRLLTQGRPVGQGCGDLDASSVWACPQEVPRVGSTEAARCYHGQGEVSLREACHRVHIPRMARNQARALPRQWPLVRCHHQGREKWYQQERGIFDYRQVEEPDGGLSYGHLHAGD